MPEQPDDRRVHPRSSTRKEHLISHADLNELAYRNQNGLEVTLLWDRRLNAVSVEVVNQLDDNAFRIA